jgi:hypothetical protein
MTPAGIAIFFLALGAGGVIDFGESEGSLSTLLAQTFVVLAWVALWAPGYRLLTAAGPLGARMHSASGGQLEDGPRPAAGREATWWDEQALQHFVVLPEEPGVEVEPHPEGVDGRAAGDQQPRPGRVPVESRQAEQARPETDRDRHLMPADDAARQRFEAGDGHRHPKVPATSDSPPSARIDFWLDFALNFPPHCNPAFRRVPSKARN